MLSAFCLVLSTWTATFREPSSRASLPVSGVTSPIPRPSSERSWTRETDVGQGQGVCHQGRMGPRQGADRQERADYHPLQGPSQSGKGPRVPPCRRGPSGSTLLHRPIRHRVVGPAAHGVTSRVPNIKDLIDRSSVGEGLRELAFGKALREMRLRFRLTVDDVCRHSNLSRGRVIEIESGAPPAPSVAEIEAIASAIGVPPDRIRALR